MSDLLAALARERVVPVVRAGDRATALGLAGRLVERGAGMIELTATTPDWTGALDEARRAWPEVIVGVGTLRSEAEAEQAVAAGARFLVSPWPAPGVRTAAERHGLLFLEGGFTPAELAAATAHGPAKLFPAHVGGPAYLRSLLAVLPGAMVVPTGGIQPDEVDAYLEAGALAVGINADRWADPPPG